MIEQKPVTIPYDLDSEGFQLYGAHQEQKVAAAILTYNADGWRAVIIDGRHGTQLMLERT